jgi:exodeoxyribonuclease-3
MLSVASFNVNGIRSFIKTKALPELLKELDVDVLCVQETKLSQGDAAVREDLANSLPTCESFFSTCSSRGGYAGVACFAREGLVAACHDWWTADEPCECPECAALRLEGRVLVLELSSCVIINVYCPNGGKEKLANPSLPLKTEFLRRLRSNVDAYHRAGRSVVVCGDLNVVGAKEDIWYDLRDWEKAVQQGEPCMSRALVTWMQGMLAADAGGLVDSFRVLHAGHVKYSWFDAKTQGREQGRGWRLDYILVSQPLSAAIAEADIVHAVRGSDHCPMLLRIKLAVKSRPAGAAPPALCLSRKNTKMQKSILSFFGGPSAPKKPKSDPAP